MFKKSYVVLITVAVALIIVIASLTFQKAEAQEVAVSKIIIPSGGLVFETTSGEKIAILLKDEYGGNFCVFNNEGTLFANIRMGTYKEPEDLEETKIIMDDLLDEFVDEVEVLSYDVDDTRDWMWSVEDRLTAFEEQSLSSEIDEIKNWLWSLKERIVALEEKI
jgi:hypothetical protein